MDHADIDHTGLTGVGGSVATDAIWDAAGDLAVGSGANTAAKLSIGATNGMSLRRVSGAVAWAFPPGHEFDYAQITSNFTTTQTVEASADTVVSGGAVTYDGSTVIYVEFFTFGAHPDNGAAGRWLQIDLFDGTTALGPFAFVRTPAAADMDAAVMGRIKLTPSAASHTYSARGFVSAGTGTVRASAGAPSYIRQVKA